MERWQRPPVVLAADPDEQVLETSDGRLQRNTRLTVDSDTAERLRTGYMCANCMERFQFPWPERCSGCGVPVREKQAEYFARQFRGVEIFRPTDWEEEIERMWDQVEREQREKR